MLSTARNIAPIFVQYKKLYIIPSLRNLRSTPETAQPFAGRHIDVLAINHECSFAEGLPGCAPSLF